jgi:hypothetical protein
VEFRKLARRPVVILVDPHFLLAHSGATPTSELIQGDLSKKTARGFDKNLAHGTV